MSIATPNALVARMAVTLGEQGFRVVRVHANDKRPVGLEWTTLATSDVDVLSRQFSTGPLNLGVACGPQPNDINLVVIDVDTRDDGLAKWAALIAEHGEPVTAMHRTPSGGLHIFFDAPAGDYPAKLVDGIDVRRAGHQVVVPPSSRLVNGVEVYYTEADRHSGLHRHPIAAMPMWLLSLLARPERPVRLTPPATNEHHANIMDWFRDAWPFDVFLGELLADGWTVHHDDAQGVHLTRPDKDRRAGSSGQLHFDGRFAIWSTSAPAELQEPLRDRQINNDASLTWSAWDYFVAVRCNRDYGLATERAMAMAGWEAPARAVAGHPAGDDRPLALSEMVLPEEFWTASPIYQAIRQDAWSALMPPALALGAVIARYAATIPTCYRIPALVGRVGSLNLATCIVSSSGGGKTSMMDAAVYLVPSNLDQPGTDGRPGKTMFNQGMGSGEGMLDAYYEEFTKESAKGKTTMERTRWYDAVNYMIDEGGAILAQLERSGTTEIDYFNSLWAGATVSTRTATKERRRHLEAHSYRFTVALNIQTARGHRFLHKSLIETGFPQRLLFVWGDDPNLPDEDLDRPDPLDLPLWPINPVTELEYDPQIRDQVRSYRRQRARGELVEAHLDRHYWLTREKTAAVLAMMHGSGRITLEYWDHALAIHAASDKIRNHLIQIDADQRGDERQHLAEMNGALDAVRLEASKRKQVATYAARLLRHVKTAGNEGIALADLRKRLTKDERWAFEPCIERLVGDGLIQIDGQRARST